MYVIRRILGNPYIVAAIWIALGVGTNTAPPHYPSFSGQFSLQFELHSLVQYVISVALWPLSFWHPNFTVGKWTGF